MTAQKLFIGAVAVTVIMAGSFFVASGSLVRAQTSTTPTPSASVNASPSASVSPSPAGSPSPIVTIAPIGETITVVQRQWTREQSGTGATVINNLNSSKNIKLCGAEKDLGDKSVLFANYLGLKRVNRAKESKKLVGIRNEKLSNSYVISNVFSLPNAADAQWSRIHITFDLAQPGTLELYYRVSNTGGTSAASDKDWIKLADPASISTEQCGTAKAPQRLASFDVNRPGKYFQYMVRVVSPQTGKQQVIRQVSFHGQQVERTESYPSPSPTLIPTPSPTNMGKITILTRKLIIEKQATDDDRGGAPLPDLTTPSPKITPSAKASAKPTNDPLCFAGHETDFAPEVPVRLRQIEGGDKLVEDETTNDLGQWKGLGGKTDDFLMGTYRINFGDFEKEDYKLVALCVSPDDHLHYVKTQTTVSGSQAVILVQPNKETKVTALYAPRDKPYISMDKFAVTENNKVKRVAYPGQSFRYVIRYENTGEAAAHNVVIRDVVPEQFYVPNEENYGEDGPFSTEIDNKGRTVVTKNVGVLEKGQKGSLVIPVVLRSNAFGSPDDIASQFGIETSSGSKKSSETTTKTSSEPTTNKEDEPLTLE